MENSTKALLMAFSMMMFVIAFTYSMYMINKLLTTSSVLLNSVSTTNYYDNIEVTSDSPTTTREVGIETIVPVLYRYYKENYAVRIVEEVEENGKKFERLIQLFDTSIESQIANAANYKGDTSTKEGKVKLSLKNSIYNREENQAYMFKAPWASNLDNAKIRVDYFLNGTKGYINNGLVDYSKKGPAFTKDGGFLANYVEDTFVESFVEYAYKGETISTEDGLETITGSTQESNKIIITYKLKNN